MIAQKSNFDFIENIFFISEYNEFIELHMLSECSHNIISNSTFSWWASFLNKNDAKKINNISSINNATTDIFIMKIDSKHFNIKTNITL